MSSTTEHISEKINEKKNYDLSNLTVLLVEDSLPMQKLLASMLDAFGIGNVLQCIDGTEAINLLTITQARQKHTSIESVDLIITDWLMPEGSGVELIDWIRAHEADTIRFLPIILVSAYTSQKTIETARDHGANEAMVKPVSGQKLAQRILSVIDKPRPFIKAPHFFGPDRRRQHLSFPGDDRRVAQPEEIETHEERL